MNRLLGAAAVVLLLSGLFWLLERRWRPHPAKPAAELRADLLYWFITPLLTRPAVQAAVALALLPVLLLGGGELSRQAVMAGHGPVARWPLWLQGLVMVVAGDFIGYWTHRAFHRGWLWRVHAVHHSSVHLDWLSAVRVHPLNQVLTRTAHAVPLVACGFSPAAVAAWLPFLTLYALFIHADLDWDFGPLRWCLATPAFHRWHHSSEQEGLDRNFAGLLPLWDLLFGTFHLPRGRRARVFGTPGAGVPAGVWGQMAYPFRAGGKRGL